MLELQHLQFSAPTEGGKLDILKDLSLQVDTGRFLVITGPNGGGKTTLARAIMGIVQVDGGKILLDGADLTHLSVTERAKQGVSYAFQQPPRFKGMKVSDLLNIASGRRLSHDQACQYLTQVGLCARDYVDRDVDASLSGGEVKRIEIASILARNSKLMIFDEPEAGIDLWSFSRLTETFRRIHEKREATLIIISHQERIIDLADEIVMIAGGVVTEHGPKAEIFPKIMANTLAGCSYMGEDGVVK